MTSWGYLFTAGALLVAAVVVMEARHFRYGASLSHPTRVRLTDADRAAARAALPTVHDVDFPTSGGLTLRGFYVPSKNGAAVVLGHGLSENRMHFLREATFLAAHGYGVLFFDSRDQGDSDGDFSTWSDLEQDDLRAAVDLVARQPDVSPGRIGLHGFSVSASTVVLEAAGDARVRGVVAEALWPSFEDELRHSLGKQAVMTFAAGALGARRGGIRPERIRPIDVIARIAPRPLLLIAGAEDGTTPVADIERAFAAAKEPKELWVVPGARHGEVEHVDPAGFERRILAFFDAALR